MRHLLTLAALLGATACSFYAPVVSDCSIACGDLGACPSGFTCRGTFCRPAGGPAEDCACRAGTTQSCGTDEGECVVGAQTCSATGAWGPCVGSVGPTEERCDGKDNDCDGLTDLGPVKTLVTDNTGPFEGFWRLHGHDAGYTMVTPLALDDGGMEVRALVFDSNFDARGRSDVIVEGDWRRVDSMVEGNLVYVGYKKDNDVQLSRVGPDGVVTVLGTYADAGYDTRMQVGVGPRGLVTVWLAEGPAARVAKWPRAGGPPAVYDLPALPEGDLWWLDMTTDGQFVMLEGTLPDGGYLDVVQDIDQPAPRTLTAPYWNAARFMTRKNGQIVHLDIQELDGETKVIFFRDYAVQAPTAYMVVEEAGRWHDSDFTLNDTEDLVAAYVNEATQRLVLARIEGTTASDQQVTRFVLEGVTVPITSANGNVRVTKAPGDPMFGLAWSTRKQVFARRFCSP